LKLTVKRAAQAAFFIACGKLAIFLPSRLCEHSETIQGFVCLGEAFAEADPFA
jgi:hypothetical protein